jgi:hypothetical protein
MMLSTKLAKQALIKALFFFTASLTCSDRTSFISLVRSLQAKLAPPNPRLRKHDKKLEL